MMKKLLTLMLVLLLTLCLAAPALAFTSDTDAKSDVPYELNLYLVDYEDNDLFGIASLPQSDRGYAKNEIVAAIVELYVPEYETIQPPENIYLILSGENVDFDVTDNYDSGVLSFKTSFSMTDPDVAVILPVWDIVSPANHDSIYIHTIRLPGEDTYKWLFFAKITGDYASLTAKLKDGMVPDIDFEIAPDGFPITLDGIDYIISKTVNGSGSIHYEIAVIHPDSDYVGYQFWIDTDKNYKSEGMTIVAPPNLPAVLGVTTGGKLGVASTANPAVLLTSGDLYDDVMDFYNDIVVGVFGLDYFNIGNYVRDSYFENLISPRTLIATVDIEPWTAYVTVPDKIVTDPPKTGDAASIMGFVMVAFSAGGAVALKKRG